MGTSLLIDPARGADPTDPKVIFAQSAQRAYGKSQDLLGAQSERPLMRPFSITWHDLGLSEYPGQFILVNQDEEDLVDLIGGVVRVEVESRSTLVFVLGSAIIGADFSLARSAYLRLAPLNYDPLVGSVGVVHEP